jgi:hypothetical protein
MEFAICYEILLHVKLLKFTSLLFIIIYLDDAPFELTTSVIISGSAGIRVPCSVDTNAHLEMCLLHYNK